MTPRASVVVPAYNNADYIAETIDSILNQTYQDFELIISDHSSTDDTVKILSTEAGGGAKRNWDRVSEAANGELLKLVCGDDTIYPECLAEQVAAFDEHPRWAEGTGHRRDAARKTVTAGANIFGEPGCVLMKRSALKAIGWWDDTNPYVIDEATYTAVALQGDVYADRQALASFRVNAGQWRCVWPRIRHARQRHSTKISGIGSDLVSAMDVRIGDARALATSFMRRGVYMLLRHRMS
ncbi:unnamed protein product, partial [Mesorhabditis spiculigera]